MEKIETNEYQLKLGMIIRFIAESNDNLHNKIFLIDYLDNDLIKIINNDFDRYQLTINDGKLSDESIEELHILEEPTDLGYAKQHGLKTNTWWSFHFGGTVPEVINGEITNLEEDCIEITTYPNKDVIYIDFQYKGIPLNLPLEEPIVPFYPPKETLLEDDEETITKIDRDELDMVLFDDEDDELIHEFDNEGVKELLDSNIIDADDIQFGDEKQVLTRLTGVSDDQKIFNIDTQTNDLLDDMLSLIPTNKRSPLLLKKINDSIDKFKGLRETFSNFNIEGIVESIKKNTANYKPLSESLFYLNKELKWLRPIVKNRLQLYNVTGEEDDDDLENTIIKKTTQDFITDHINAFDLYYSGRIPIEQNKYIYVHQQTLKPYFSSPIDKKNIIIENMDDFQSPVATSQEQKNKGLLKDDIWEDSSNIDTTRFNKTKYIKGIKYSEYNRKLKKYDVLDLTYSNTINIKGFLLYPLSVINYSKLYLNNMNMYDRVNLHNVSYIESFFLDKNKFIPRYDIQENSEDFDSEFKNLKTINTVLFKEENNIDDRRTNETYVDFLNKMIPKTKSIFLSLIKNKLQLQNCLSYHEIVNYLEPFLMLSQ